jgi:hypothetical protein
MGPDPVIYTSHAALREGPHPLKSDFLLGIKMIYLADLARLA